MNGSGRATSRPASHPARAVAKRHHVILPHTADIGFEASAGDLGALFEEAAAALAELTAETAPSVSPTSWLAVDLRAADLPGLAFAWLNELIALSEIHRSAIVSVDVDHIDHPPRIPAPSHPTLAARVGLHSLGSADVRPLRAVKSATFHGLVVQRVGRRWVMRAYLDV
jgi:SHS2 domain-containing protein